MRHEEEIILAELFEEKLCELVRNYRHLCDVTSPGHRDKQMEIKNSCEETGKQLNISRSAAKEKWRSVRDRFVRAPPGGCIG